MLGDYVHVNTYLQHSVKGGYRGPKRGGGGNLLVIAL